MAVVLVLSHRSGNLGSKSSHSILKNVLYMRAENNCLSCAQLLVFFCFKHKIVQPLWEAKDVACHFCLGVVCTAFCNHNYLPSSHLESKLSHYISQRKIRACPIPYISFPKEIWPHSTSNGKLNHSDYVWCKGSSFTAELRVWFLFPLYHLCFAKM